MTFVGPAVLVLDDSVQFRVDRVEVAPTDPGVATPASGDEIVVGYPAEDLAYIGPANSYRVTAYDTPDGLKSSVRASEECPMLITTHANGEPIRVDEPDESRGLSFGLALLLPMLLIVAPLVLLLRRRHRRRVWVARQYDPIEPAP
jgi:hypothetical protein